MIPLFEIKIKCIFAFFCEYMQILKNLAKSLIYNRIHLLKTTKKMYKRVNKYKNMHKICNIQNEAEHTLFEMFVQIAKGNYKNGTQIFVLCPKKMRKEEKSD